MDITAVNGNPLPDAKKKKKKNAGNKEKEKHTPASINGRTTSHHATHQIVGMSIIRSNLSDQGISNDSIIHTSMDENFFVVKGKLVPLISL